MVHIVRRDRTPREMLRFSLDGGKPSRVTSGSYIDDLTALGKVLSLCGLCRPKFNEASVGYATRSSLPHARGTCDGCGNFSEQNSLFFKQGQY